LSTARTAGPFAGIRTRRQIRQRLNDLNHAGDYRTWREIAFELDRLEGHDAWKADDTSDDYDHLLIKERLSQMRSLRRKGDVRRLVYMLHEGLHGNLGNISTPALYSVARVGTKQLIEQYVEEVCRCLDYVCVGDFPDFPEDEKILFFKRTGTSFGRSALMLSGGATLGMFHLGVIRALWEQDLLPRVISGSSAGSIIAAMVGTHTDAELPRLFDPDALNLRAFQNVSLTRALRGRALMDPKQLEDCLRENVGDESFEEAFERTRRIIGITISPAEPHQQGRLLNYLTAPNVMIRRATLASCAVPGIFPPVMLEARDYVGRTVPYMPGKRWVDGSLSSDLPMLRLARLHNCNHYIVSQTNPHVVPFLRDRLPRTGMLPFAKELVTSSGANWLKLARKHFDVADPVIGKLYGVIRQRYSGDINIFPRHSPQQLMRMFANPSAEDIRRFIRDGERATWPRIERVRNQTRISRAFEACLLWLKQRSRSPAHPRPRLRAVS
jgi:TAG lipase / steryl ester hydrolase / phospholipase A2 / LPA acyltransferase